MCANMFILSLWLNISYRSRNGLLEAGWLFGFVKQVKPDNKTCALKFLGLQHCYSGGNIVLKSSFPDQPYKLSHGRLMSTNLERNTRKQYIYF